MKKLDEDMLRTIASIAAFMVPATALWLRSGYQYGAALFLFAALFCLPRLIRESYSRATIGIAVSFFAMAVLWCELYAFGDGFGRVDRSAKFLASILCLMYAMTFPPKRQAFYWGLAIGCAGAGLMGLWQVYHLELERANGYTNAIQWGNVALLMATMLAIQLSVFWHERSGMHRAVILFCILLGVEASILSASRGGWIALGAVIPLMGIFIFSYRRDLFKKFGLTVIVAAALIVATNTNMLCDRFETARDEVSEYLKLSDKTQTASSLGIRLEQYRTAFEMIKEKPLFGWGAREYLKEMHKRVDEGRYAESTRQFNFIHNEFIDLWVKTGIPGMIVQAFLYIYTLLIFWPTARRMKKREAAPQLWKEELALRLCGITLPVMYFIFGQSQHFFVHNIGIIVFTFFVIILWSALSGLKHSEENISHA